MAEKTIVAAGHICLDIIPALSAAGGDGLIPGRLLQCGAAALATGGAASNTGLALHRLGLPARIVAKVGDDLFGRGILEIIRGHSPDLAAGIAVAPGAGTSYSVVISPPGVDRTFLHCPGANDTFGAEDVSDAALAGAGLLHFGYPPLMRRMYADDGAECARLFQRARAHGLTTSLDMARPDPASPAGRADWVAWLGRVLPAVDVFLPSIDEILFMLDRRLARLRSPASGKADLLQALDRGVLAAAAGRLLELGAAVVVLKLGDQGLYLRTAASRERLKMSGACAPSAANGWFDRELLAGCFEVRAVGTTGAGDCTIAGFLAALARGRGPEEAMRMAVAAGACSVEAADAWSGVRPWNEIEKRIAAGWKQRPPNPRLLPKGDVR